jgi:hypothetical protein
MAARYRYLIGRGLRFERSYLKLSCGPWPGSRRRIRYASEVAREGGGVRSGWFCRGHLRLATLLRLVFARLLYGNRVLLRLGRDTRSLGLLRRLDQLEIAVA